MGKFEKYTNGLLKAGKYGALAVPDYRSKAKYIENCLQ